MRTLLRRLRYLLRFRQHQADLDEEMAFHREMLGRATDYQEAAKAFGNVTLAREDARSVWLAPWLESVWQDLTYAVRSLVRQPAFAILAIGALTAGIRLNVSLFTVYSALALKPWTVKDPDRVVGVISTSAYDERRRAGGAPGGSRPPRTAAGTCRASSRSSAWSRTR